MALIEERQSVDLARNIVDVRSWGAKYAERLSAPEFFVVNAIPLLALVWFVPVGLLVWVTLFVALTLIHVSYRVILPLRYPVDAMKPPEGKKKPSPGDGILYLGAVKSSSAYEDFRETWLADSDLRTHFLILGSTGSGKSETLKGMFFNALCWGSGFFLADGKADNKMPTDLMAMCRMLGVDDDFLALNFLIGGSSPEKIRMARRKRTNGINTFSDSDADTQIQMGANLLPKAEGDGKSWQEKALNFWRALVTALCYKRDVYGMELSVGTYIEYMGLNKAEELYVEGYREYIRTGEWSYGFAGIKSYFESGGLPGFLITRVKLKYNLPPDPNEAAIGQVPANALPGRGPAGAGGAKEKTEQESSVFDQHGFRIGQLMPALNLLDKTYGHIFRSKYSEIDMVDVALNNRVLVMMIPSLEKSAQEAENLGKLAIACLRVMMGRNLGADIEGNRAGVLESKATEANYPFFVALDELGYYFSDGIAVMFAQARSLGMSMIAAAQDIEKLTEGSRKAEAGAMLANAVAKLFMRIDDAQSTFKLIVDYLGKIRVAVYNQFVRTAGGFRRDGDGVTIETVERAQVSDLQKLETGMGFLNTRGKTFPVRCLYVGEYLERHKMADFRLNRFMQVAPLSDEEAIAYSQPATEATDSAEKGKRLVGLLDGSKRVDMVTEQAQVFTGLDYVAETLPKNLSGGERGIALFLCAKAILDNMFEADPPAEAPPGGISRANGAERLDDAVLVPSMEVAQQALQAGMRTPEVASADQPVPDDSSAGATGVFDPLAYLGLSAEGGEGASLPAVYERRPVQEVLIGVGAQQAVDAALVKERAALQGAQGGPRAGHAPGATPAADPRVETLARQRRIEAERANAYLEQMMGGLDPEMAGEIRSVMGLADTLVLAQHERETMSDPAADGPAHSGTPRATDATGAKDARASLPAADTASAAVPDLDVDASEFFKQLDAPGPVATGRDEDFEGAASLTLGYDKDAVRMQREAATVILATAGETGGDVVGFRQNTRDNIAAVEVALGGADPATAVREIEQIVASQVTPFVGLAQAATRESAGRDPAADAAEDDFDRLLAGLVD